LRDFHYPEFIPTDPEYWLSQMELIYETCGITNDNVKYSHLNARLPPAVNLDLKDIANLPVGTRYDAARKAIIERVGKSTNEKYQEVLRGQRLDGRKPSVFLRHLRAITNNMLTEDYLRAHFKHAMPKSIQVQIAAYDDDPLDRVAKWCDSIREISPALFDEVPTIHAVAVPRSDIEMIDLAAAPCAEVSLLPTASNNNLGQQVLNALSTLSSDMRAQTTAINQVTTTLQSFEPRLVNFVNQGGSQRQNNNNGGYRNNGNRGGNNSNNRGGQRPKSDNPVYARPRREADVCPYHEWYGRGARRCQLPCKHSSGMKPEQIAQPLDSSNNA